MQHLRREEGHIYKVWHYRFSVCERVSVSFLSYPHIARFSPAANLPAHAIENVADQLPETLSGLRGFTCWFSHGIRRTRLTTLNMVTKFSSCAHWVAESDLNAVSFNACEVTQLDHWCHWGESKKESHGNVGRKADLRLRVCVPSSLCCAVALLYAPTGVHILWIRWNGLQTL